MGPTARAILNNWHRPGWWAGSVLPTLQLLTIRRLSQLIYSPPQPPVAIMAEDWDNLILLDGCRYDLYETVHTFDGEPDYRISPASATPEFLKANFAESAHHDTVYVTANPMYRRLPLGEAFHAVIDVWDDHWTDGLNTVRPSKMVEVTTRAHEQYPDKRLLVHFMQPHYPFIGDLADELGDHAGIELAYRQVTGGPAARDAPTVWERLERGEVSRELVWAAYRENLELTLPHVESLLDRLLGKTVVTSDHGNLLGERPFPFAARLYGHPNGVHCDELCKVPWQEFEGLGRKEVISEPPAERQAEETPQVTERLADLGYVDA